MHIGFLLWVNPPPTESSEGSEGKKKQLEEEKEMAVSLVGAGSKTIKGHRHHAAGHQL